VPAEPRGMQVAAWIEQSHALFSFDQRFLHVLTHPGGALVMAQVLTQLKLVNESLASSLQVLQRRSSPHTPMVAAALGRDPNTSPALAQQRLTAVVAGGHAWASIWGDAWRLVVRVCGVMSSDPMSYSACQTGPSALFFKQLVMRVCGATRAPWLAGCAPACSPCWLCDPDGTVLFGRGPCRPAAEWPAAPCGWFSRKRAGAEAVCAGAFGASATQEEKKANVLGVLSGEAAPAVAAAKGSIVLPDAASLQHMIAGCVSLMMVLQHAADGAVSAADVAISVDNALLAIKPSYEANADVHEAIREAAMALQWQLVSL
jgi:hypothetical protein